MSVPIHPSATVVLLREDAGRLQTWLMRRTSRMNFAAGMSVFPGGRIDAADGADAFAWLGDDPAALAARFGCSVEVARGSLVAAVREVFEETGVLIADPVGDYAALAQHRRAVENGQVAFADVLREAGLRVDARRLRPFARWITPASESRRFDTLFYVAALPAGARALADSVEASAAEWMRPVDALAQFEAGERPMLPPTVLTLATLAAFERIADVLAFADNQAEVIVPRPFDLGARPLTLSTSDGTTYAFPAKSAAAIRQATGR